MALALGGRNVAELKASTSYREFLQWLAFWERESPGETDSNWQIATMAAAICRALGAKYTPNHFMPPRRRRGRRRRQSEADSLAAFEAATRTRAPRRPPKGA